MLFRIDWYFFDSESAYMVRIAVTTSILYCLVVLVPTLCLAQSPNIKANQITQADPPFSGTIFIDPDIITPSDVTTFQSVSYSGRGFRTMYDRRVNNWITVSAYLFDASFDDGLTAEIQVNPEFGSSSAALAEAQKYGPVIGQLPTALRADVQTVWIHKGTQPFGGGNNNLLIHIGQADLYVNDGILEETFVHEAAHTSLDAAHANSSGWLAAQVADAEFISTYARDFPNREDIAESFLPYLAVRYRSNRISQSLKMTIMQTIPNRIAYFDNQSFDMYPISKPTTSVKEISHTSLPKTLALFQNYPNPFNLFTIISYSIPKPGFVILKVYDSLGKEIQTLVNKSQQAKTYSIHFDAGDLSSGIYFYRLYVETEYVRTKKMLIMK